MKLLPENRPPAVSETKMLERLESEVWGLGNQMRPYTIFSNPDDPKWAEKTGSEKKSEFFKTRAFAEDVQSVFHPLISGADVFRRCKLDRILKLAEETRGVPTSAIEVQMVPNFPG